MTILLYHGWTSSASRRVRLFLEEKGLTYVSHEIDLATQQQHSPEYLRINPNGVVPAIVHNGQVVHESSTICEYLDDVFPETPLRPLDAYDRALMRNWVRYVDSLIGNLIRFNWRHRLQKKAAAMSDDELQQMIARVPSQERREAWLRVARKPYTEEELDQARMNLQAMVGKMEEMMAGGWLVGRQYSLADIAVVPFIVRIHEEIAPDSLTRSTHPNVAAWWEAIQARPAFKRARMDPFVSG